MLTKDLIAQVASQTKMTKKQTEQLLSTTTAVISESLCSGKAVQLMGFGILEPRQRAARVVVHPKTGEKQTTPEKVQVVLRASNILKEELKNI